MIFKEDKDGINHRNVTFGRKYLVLFVILTSGDNILVFTKAQLGLVMVGPYFYRVVSVVFLRP